MNLEVLKPRANKHKKWLENKVIINPFSYDINDVGYYLVIYKRGDTVKGYTIISETSYSEEDAKKAFEKLVVFTVFGNKFFEIEKSKMKLSPNFFYNTSEVIDSHLQSNQKNNYLLKGREALLELGDLLRELQDHIQNYIRHYDDVILKTNKIDESEFEIIYETLSHINRIQYLQGRTFLDSFSDLKNMQSEMKKLNLDKQLTQEQKVSLKELLSGTKETEQSIKAFDTEKEIAHLPVEEQIKIIVEELKEIGRKKLPRYKQDLRYPKI
jgi:hypothetical protein